MKSVCHVEVSELVIKMINHESKLHKIAQQHVALVSKAFPAVF